MSNETYAKVFDSIITAMENGTAPWVKPWSTIGHRGGGNLPYNAITGRRYSGGNVPVLWFAGALFGSNGWVTFKQALSADCVVRKGEKGTPVYYMSVVDRTKKDSDKEEKFFFVKSFTVFNVEQLDELKDGALDSLKARHGTPAPRSEFEQNEEAEQFVRCTGARVVHGGDNACFIPSIDLIRMPLPQSFTCHGAYYGTLFHELTHWTGHESRLNRITPARFGSPEYAFEELVAELGAAFLSAEHGYDTVSQSAAYLKSWAKACREMPDMFAKAASLATKAVESMHQTAEEADMAEAA